MSKKQKISNPRYKESRKLAIAETNKMSRKEIRKAIQLARKGTTDTRRAATLSKIPGIFSSARKKKGYIMTQKMRSIDPLRRPKTGSGSFEAEDDRRDASTLNVNETFKKGGKIRHTKGLDQHD